MKKFLALLLAMTLILSLAACGAKTETPAEPAATETPAKTEEPKKEEPAKTEEPAKEEEEVFTVFGMTGKTFPLAENAAWLYGIERAGIQIELTEVIPSEYLEKANLLLNSGEYPDAFWKCSYLDWNGYGMQGIFIPLEDLIREYAPNLTMLLDEREAWDDIAAADGHIYALPSFDGLLNCVIANTGPQWINQRWLDNLGLEMPTSRDELYEVLKAFKEQDANGNGDPNDEIPYIYNGGTTSILPALSLLADDVLLYKDYSGLTEGEMGYFPTTEAYKELLEFAAKLYAEGLMHTDTLILTTEQRDAIGQAGDVIGMSQHSSANFALTEYQMDYVSVISWNKGGYPLNTGVNAGGMAITDACENPGAILSWIDFFYSEEGGLVSCLGPVGVGYQVNEDGTYSLFNDKFESRVYQTTLMGSGIYPCITPAYRSTGINPKDNPLEAYSGEQCRKALGSGTSLPALIFTEEENEQLSVLSADITPYVDNYTAEIISGQLTLEESWDDYMKTLEEMGVETLSAIYVAAYERATAG